MRLLVKMMVIMAPSILNPQQKWKKFMKHLKAKDSKSCITIISGSIYCLCNYHNVYYQLLYRTLEELGSGEFGVVSRGMLSSTTGDVEVAVKMLNTDASDKDKLKFLQEAAIMCQFDHQNVIKLHGVVTEAPIMIVLEYVARGDLREFLMNLQFV